MNVHVKMSTRTEDKAGRLRGYASLFRILDTLCDTLTTCVCVLCDLFLSMLVHNKKAQFLMRLEPGTLPHVFYLYRQSGGHGHKSVVTKRGTGTEEH